ncbi:ribosomal protein L27 [Verruconis gallopava]|uniref:Large ribosomal subunit protein bL27m n=1 Tax=Verruconis gallopava TaxID=253628 RepID=A0A0D2A3Y7_9PEZI|nr:ribosomal protein L27 [Verruconis gallopava]KIW01503.1 ribosomal protein L27 [Verruconis gallopava]
MAASSLSRPARAVLLSSRYISLPLRPSDQALHYLRSLNNRLRQPVGLTSVRQASHQAQGRANGPKNGPGKRLGAKKTGEQFVVPGNIIYRQRGTLWFPGENCAMGRDHTIYATEKGYVKYYRDPFKHPKRRYIGVALERDWSLPTPKDAPRRRRLGMIPVRINEDSSHLTDNYVPRPSPIAGLDENSVLPEGMSLEPSGKGGHLRPTFTLKDGTLLKMRSNYMFREDNWQIGRAAERARTRVRPFKKGNRWLAWRKRTAKRARIAEMKSVNKKGKAKKKATPRS